MKERSLYPMIMKGAHLDGWALYHIRDDSDGEKPVDILGVNPTGVAVAMECKVVKSIDQNSPLPFHLLQSDNDRRMRKRGHQERWLKAFAVRNALALFALYVEPERQLYIYRLNHYHFDEPHRTEVLARHFTPMVLKLQGELFRGWQSPEAPKFQTETRYGLRPKEETKTF